VPWRGQFYPDNLDPKNYLSYYSTRLEFVEVNLSNGSKEGISKPSNLTGKFQGRPRSNNTHDTSVNSLLDGKITKRWAEQTPEQFRFSISMPRAAFVGSEPSELVDELGDLDAQERIGRFLENLKQIKGKVIAITIDILSSLTLGTHRDWLEQLLRTCSYHDYRVALQFRHISWYQDLTYNLMKKYNATVIWSADSNRLPSVVNTSNLLYLRFYMHEFRNSRTGNSSSIEQEAEQWAKIIQKVQEISTEGQVDAAILVVDNPTQAMLVRKLVGLPEAAAVASAVSEIASRDHFGKVEESSIKHTENGRPIDRVIVCVDLNAFYPSCEELRNPSLRGKPHAVIMTDQNAGEITKGVVSSCSYEARKYGVRSAMPLARARNLCPDMVLLPVDIPYYSQVSAQVMEVLAQFSDTLEQSSIDEAFLDCTQRVSDSNSSYITGQALEELGMRIKQAVREKCGLLCSVGIAPTKSAAKIASDYRKPDGLSVVTAAELRSFLQPLEVSKVSGVGPKTEKALKEMGVSTLGQLAKTDAKRLADRFGKNGYWMWKVANGLDDEPVVQRGDHVSVSTETTLEAFTLDKQEVSRMLHELVGDIYRRAAKHGYSFRTVGVKLVRTDFAIETREITFPDYQNSQESISSVIDKLVEKFEFTRQPAIRKIGIKLSHLSRNSASSKETVTAKPKIIQKTLLDYNYS
jgi:DNA polymerase IV (DinB-like DNA polymerase)